LYPTLFPATRRVMPPSGLALKGTPPGNRYRSDRAIRSPRSQSSRNHRRASSSESQPASATTVANSSGVSGSPSRSPDWDRVDAVGALLDHRETGSGSDQHKRTVLLHSLYGLAAVIIHPGAPQSLYFV
jgi:hypothetical protein